ncbi:UNVERIFIED_CONTAM: hypothetical protein HDU68_002060 [Siphonaria sp. JEL0065]|nr:hypothetical protein HDU68_002060 [Siphonaria sp. JEL0065]
MSTNTQSFAQLFRSSKLATITYNPGSIAPHVIRGTDANRVRGEQSCRRIQQLTSSSLPYVTLLAIGEWGLKHTLPTDLNPSTVLVSSLDHPTKRSCEFRTATKDVAQLHRFRKLFGAFLSLNSVAQKSEKVDLARISDKEFQELVKKAREFYTSKKEGSWEEELGVDCKGSASGLIHPPFYWAPTAVVPEERTVFLSSVPEQQQQQQAQDHQKDPQTVPINARHAVGMSGYVAFLPDAEVSSGFSQRRQSASGKEIMNREFADQHERKPGNEITVYVQNVQWDDVAGRWRIGVTQKNPAEQGRLFDLPSGSGSGENMTSRWLSAAAGKSSLTGGNGGGNKGLETQSILQQVQARPDASAFVRPRKPLPEHLQKRTDDLSLLLRDISNDKLAKNK